MTFHPSTRKPAKAALPKSSTRQNRRSQRKRGTQFRAKKIKNDKKESANETSSLADSCKFTIQLYFLQLPRQVGFNCLKKSLPLSSTKIKAGKSTTSIFQIASIPSSGYSRHSMLLMLF